MVCRVAALGLRVCLGAAGTQCVPEAYKLAVLKKKKKKDCLLSSSPFFPILSCSVMAC